MDRPFVALALALGLSIASPAAAATVVFLDGHAIEGPVVELVDGSHVTLRLANGLLRRVSWSEVSSIRADGAATRPVHEPAVDRPATTPRPSEPAPPKTGLVVGGRAGTATVAMVIPNYGARTIGGQGTNLGIDLGFDRPVRRRPGELVQRRARERTTLVPGPHLRSGRAVHVLRASGHAPSGVELDRLHDAATARGFSTNARERDR
jgi:hypothetical protein